MRQFHETVCQKPRFLNDSEAEQGNHNPKVASSNLATAIINPQLLIFSNYRIKTFIFLGYLTLKNTLSQIVLYEGVFDQ